MALRTAPFIPPTDFGGPRNELRAVIAGVQEHLA